MPCICGFLGEGLGDIHGLLDALACMGRCSSPSLGIAQFLNTLDHTEEVSERLSSSIPFASISAELSAVVGDTLSAPDLLTSTRRAPS